MKLFTRYNRINLLAMVVVFLLSSIASFAALRYVLVHELDEDLYDRRHEMKRYVEQTGELPYMGNLGDEKTSCTETTDKNVKFKPKSVYVYDSEENKVQQYRQIGYTIKAKDKFYLITIARPLEGTHSLLKMITLVTVSTVFIIIIITILLNTFLLRRLWQPFYGTIATIRQFKLGTNKALAFPETDIDEFRFMNVNLSETIRKAEQDYQLLKEFTENASHEMQTPLAIIRSRLDLLIQDEDISERQQETIKSTYSAIKRLSRLNQSLLLLAKIENHQFEASEHIDLKERITEKLKQLSELWQDRDFTIHTDISDAAITANPELTDILLNNLFGNAGRHNTTHGSIWVSLQQGELKISNTGRMQSLDTERLFRRFYKEEQHSHHNGLGLSIVKQICETAGIQITYSYKEGIHSFVLSW